MVAFMAMCALGASASSYVVGQRFTNVADLLSGQKFVIVNESEGKAVYNSNNQNLAYGDYATAVTGAAYQWVLNSVDAALPGCYTLQIVLDNGNSPSFWGNNDPKYLNTGKDGGFNGCFTLGNGSQYGTDVENGGAWEVEYVDGKGFTLKNKARNGYFAGPDVAAAGSTPVYWTFCTLIEDPLIAAQEKYNALKTKYLAINENLDVTDADALLASATTVDEVQTAIDKLFNTFETYLAGVEGETDLTSFIVNPSFETGNTTGWTYEGSNDAGAKDNSNGTYTIENADGAYVFNIWSSGNLISQTIDNLPNGNYKMVALIATDADHQVKLSANGISTTVDSYGGADSKKHGVDGTVEFQVLANTATIGAEGVDKYWYKVDNFRLFYTGPIVDFTPYEEALATAVNEAQEIAQGDIPNAAYQVLQTTITTYNKEWTSIDEYNTAIEAIEDATATAAGLVEPYDAYQTILSEVQALYDVAGYTELTVGAHDALGTALTTAADDVANATNATDIANVSSTLKAAGITYAGAADPAEGYEFDLTFMLTNPDLTQYWDGTWWIQPAGWFKDQTDGNFQVMNNGSVDAEDGVHTIFMEYYYLNNGTYDNGKFNIYTKATLPAGTYTMNCYAFAKEENYSSGNPNPQVFFYANDTQGSKVNSNKLTEQSISFINETEQEVKIGLKPLGGNTYNWMGIGYVKLYKEYTDNNTYAIYVTPTGCNVVVTVDDVEVTETKATKTVTLTVTPNKEYESSSVTVTATYNDGENVMDLDVANPSEGVYTYPQPAYDVNVTVTYEYLANMNITDAHYATFIAPFDVEIPDGVTAYTVNESKGEMLLMEPITGNIYGTIYANTPVVLYSEDAMSQDFKGQSTAEKDAYTVGLLTGTYVSMNKDALDGKYILQKHEGDETPAFYRVDATNEAEPSLAPSRCYLTDSGNGSKLRFSFGEEDATAINGLEVLTSGKYDAIYNAAGVKVNALQKGMNIIQKSGKTYKIFVK